MEKISLTADFSLSGLIEKYIRQFFEDKQVSAENREKLWAHYFGKLSAGVDEGYSPDIEFYDGDLAKSLKQSIAEFSAFKETSFRKTLEDLLTKDGKLTPWNDFKKEAFKVSGDYNHRWLETEYHQTVANANMAQTWKEFGENADLYPNVKLVSVRDARVRPEHKVLDGTIRPYNDPFWDTHLPPLDWGCRCHIEQTDEEPTEVKGGVQMKIEFENNPAKSGKIFGGSAYENNLDHKEVTEAKEFATDKIAIENEKDLYEVFAYSEEEIKQKDFYKKAIEINDKIRPSEAYSLFNYSIEGYDVNSYLRNGEKLNKYWSAFKNSLDNALDKLPNYEGVVHRGTEGFSDELISQYRNAFKNKSDIIHEYFTSTSKEIAVTEEFGSQIQFKINSKTGKDIEPIANFTHEKEVLFKSGTKFKVDNFEERDYGGYKEIIIELTEV